MTALAAKSKDVVPACLNLLFYVLHIRSKEHKIAEHIPKVLNSGSLISLSN